MATDAPRWPRRPQNRSRISAFFRANSSSVRTPALRKLRRSRVSGYLPAATRGFPFEPVRPGWEKSFLDAYGIEPDDDRLRYYRLLYDLAS